MVALFDSSQLILCRANGGTGQTREKNKHRISPARREGWTSIRAYSPVTNQTNQPNSTQSTDMNNISDFAISAFVTILGRLLLGATMFHKFLFYGLLFLASGVLAVVAPKLIRCKKDLDREKGLVHDLERVATADGSGRLATAIRSFLSALYDPIVEEIPKPPAVDDPSASLRPSGGTNDPVVPREEGAPRQNDRVATVLAAEAEAQPEPRLQPRRNVPDANNKDDDVVPVIIGDKVFEVRADQAEFLARVAAAFSKVHPDLTKMLGRSAGPDRRGDVAVAAARSAPDDSKVSAAPALVPQEGELLHGNCLVPAVPQLQQRIDSATRSADDSDLASSGLCPRVASVLRRLSSTQGGDTFRHLIDLSGNRGVEGQFATPLFGALQRLDKEFSGGIGHPMALPLLQDITYFVSEAMENSRDHANTINDAESKLVELRQEMVDNAEQERAWFCERVARFEEASKAVARELKKKEKESEDGVTD